MCLLSLNSPMLCRFNFHFGRGASAGDVPVDRSDGIICRPLLFSLSISRGLQMTLSDFASLSTAISGVAVTVSLIYLIIQTRQNIRHTRALIHQGSSARTTAIVLANMEADASSAWLAGNGVTPTPTKIRRAQFNL